MNDTVLLNLERRIIRTRWWCAGCILFSLSVAVFCAIVGDPIGMAANFFAGFCNHVSFRRNGVTLQKVRWVIDEQHKASNQ